jgi:hypothetical protein
MAGMKPFFLTGANAKIKVNNVTLAYCTNLSYSIIVNHASPKVLGMFESTGIEPLSYSVSGSFTVIRYVADVASNNSGTLPHGVNNGGNGIGNMGPDGIGKRLVAGINPTRTDSRTYDNLNPSKLDQAVGFEIDIFQKLSTGGQQSVAKVREARITRADFSIAKGSAATQVFQFTALYVDEDSFLADFSGQGQQWT